MVHIKLSHIDTIFITFARTLGVDFYSVDEYFSWWCKSPISAFRDVLDQFLKINGVSTLECQSMLINKLKQEIKYFMIWTLFAMPRRLLLLLLLLLLFALVIIIVFIIIISMNTL